MLIVPSYLREAFNPHTSTGKAKPPDQILRPPSDTSIQQGLNLLNQLGRQKWHVRIEPAYPYAHGVLKRNFQ